VEETVSFTLRFPGGVIASCSSSYGLARAKRYRLFDVEGWLDLDPASTKIIKHPQPCCNRQQSA